MRIVYLTDTHLGLAHSYRGAPEGWSRADDHRAAFDRALRAATEVPDIDAVIHSGDVFDRSHPPAAAVAHAVAAFTEVARQVPVYLIPGNHDRNGIAHHFAGIPGVTVSDRPYTARVGEARVGFMPFLRDPDAWGHSVRRLAQQDGFDVLVAHQAFDGATVPGYRFTARPGDETIGEQHLPAGVHTVLCGHIHPRQVRRLGRATVYYPGSTERTSFSEREETKGYAVLELGATVRVDFVDLPSRSMTEIRSAGEVAQVHPGSLVRLAPTARHVDIEAAALERGGWVAPWSPPSRQQRMFG